MDGGGLIKVFRKTFTPVFLIVLVALFNLVYADEPSLETSIVSLVLTHGEETIGKDPLFELIDKDDYVLLPLNKLSSKISYDVVYRRGDNQMIVKSLRSDKMVVINLNDKNYTIDNKYFWANQPPIILENEVYVSTSLLEYISDVKIAWDSKYQELTIDAQWFKKAPTSNENPNRAGSSQSEQKEEVIEGPGFTLGAIRYYLDNDYRMDANGDNELESLWNIRFDGAAGNWALSLAGQWDSNPDDDPYLLGTGFSLIRAKYNERNQLIIIGDSDLYFERFLSNQWDVRGLLYMYPNKQPYRKNAAYTSITGPAEPGDKVTLIVNGRQMGQIEVEGNSYSFPRVPLYSDRLNIVRTVVEKKSGQTIVNEERIAASPRVYEANTHEYMVTYGQFRKSPDLLYQDRLWGAKIHQSFGDNFSLNCEVAELKFDDYTGTIFNGDLGISARLGSSLIATADLFGSGDDPIQQSYESGLMYCFTNGYLEGKVFSLYPSLYDWLQPLDNDDEELDRVVGKGFGLEGENDLSEKWRIEYDGIITKALADTYEPSYNNYWTRLTHFSGERLQNSLETSLRKKDLEGKNDSLGSYKQAIKDLKVEYNFFGEKISGDIMGYYNTSNIDPQNLPNFGQNYFESEVNLIKMFNNNLIYNLDLTYTRNWWENYSVNGYDLQTELKLINDKNWYDGHLKVQGDSRDSISEAEVGAGIRWILKDGYSYMGLEATGVRLGLSDDTYFTSAFDAFYQINGTDSYFKGRVEYITPIENRNSPQIEVDLGVEYYFPSGFGLEASFERVYDSLWDDEPDMVFRVAISQDILFAPGRRKTVKYTDDDDISSVFGCVYLDSNGNKRYDPGEKRLSDIKIMLNERRIKTDKNGEYQFVGIEPGVYMIGFDLHTLPADFTPVSDNILVKVRQNEGMTFDFGVTIDGTISGKVILDLNGNGKVDSTDQPLSWAGIALDGGNNKVFTDSHGEFLFEKIPLGPHKVQLLLDSLPSNMLVISQSFYSFDLTDKLYDKTDLIFLVKYKFIE